MRIIHKCPAGQGSGSASPKGRARALSPSQSYRFVNNSHDLPSYGRRPQIFVRKIFLPVQGWNRQEPPGLWPEAPEELRERPSRPSSRRKPSSLGSAGLPQLSWLDLKQLTEPRGSYHGELTSTRPRKAESTTMTDTQNTDPIDTKMILAFAKSKAVRAMKAPSENCIKLAALLDRRGHLVEQVTREKNRLQNSETLIHIQSLLKKSQLSPC
jgi:hypothetical protein